MKNQDRYGELTRAETEALMDKIGGMSGREKIMSGEWVIGEPAKVVKPKYPPKEVVEQLPDTIIRVDRSIRPAYPESVDQKYIHDPKFLKLERMGPSQYDLAVDVHTFLHDEQKEGRFTTGKIVYDDLKNRKLLESCLGPADGLAIQQKGIAVFLEVFGKNHAMLWRGSVRHRSGDFSVPYLRADSDRVVLGWRAFSNFLDEDDLTLHFPPKT